MPSRPINLYDLDLEGLTALLAAWDQPAYRGKQVYRQLYVKLVEEIDEMTDLPKALRQQLQAACVIGNLERVHVQVGDQGMTRKVLWRLPEGESIESVLMIYPDRATVCVSSQAGCPMGCVFCATAKMGFLRDLTAGQIIEQVLWARRETGRSTEDDGQFLDKRAGMQAPDREGEGHVHGQQAGPERLVGPGSGVELSNVVFMGMGEAFNNYEAWWESVERLHDPAGFNMGARSFTVSTVGLVPGIERLAREELPINLAISLHAADDELRSEMMPVNRAYPIQALLQAARDYGEMTHRRVSFEYVLLEGKNDTPEQAEELARVFHEGPLGDRLQWTHVNLIPWNPVPGAPLARSSRNRVHAFQQVLQARGIPCTVRIERGVDIDAACGQLAGSHG